MLSSVFLEWVPEFTSLQKLPFSSLVEPNLEPDSENGECEEQRGGEEAEGEGEGGDRRRGRGMLIVDKPYWKLLIGCQHGGLPT